MPEEIRITLTAPVHKSLRDVQEEINIAARMYSAKDTSTITLNASEQEVVVVSQHENFIDFVSSLYPTKFIRGTDS